MIPSSSEPSYLASTSEAVYEAITAADPDSYWSIIENLFLSLTLKSYRLMQGWMFYHSSYFWKDEQIRALLTAVPQVIFNLLSLLNRKLLDFFSG